MDENKLKEILEGQDGDTSTPAVDNEQVGLNNSTIPTPQEEENAGFGNGQELEHVDEETQEQEQKSETELGAQEASATRSFTQSQVDEIAGKARKEGRDKAVKYFYSRYGVNSEEELDELFSDAQRFVTAKEDFDQRTKDWEELENTRLNELREVKEKVALLESGIDKDRYEDAKLILKGKGLDVSIENINSELATHPEWKKTELGIGNEDENGNSSMFKKKSVSETGLNVRKESAPVTKINVLGNNSSDTGEGNSIMSDRERILKMFGV